MLTQVRSSSYTEGDSKRKTLSERRRNDIRIDGNGKSTREADREGRNGEAVTEIIGRGKMVADACVEGPNYVHRFTGRGRADEFGNGESFMAGETVVGSFRGMKNVPGWRR